jgi:hypothetical protein
LAGKEDQNDSFGLHTAEAKEAKECQKRVFNVFLFFE